MIRTEALRKEYQTASGEVVVAVRGATLEVRQGEVFGLLGPNGAGKTTLLRMLGCIITPTSGRYWVNEIPADEARDELRRHIGFLSGNTKLYGRLTPRELLSFFGALYSMSKSDIRARTDEIIGMLDMGSFADRRCETLSTGQAQRVSIARAIFHDPQVLILDEPTLGLDIITSRSIIEFIQNAKLRGHTIILSTHYMTEAELLCDRVGFIHRGEVLVTGTQEELYTATGTANLYDAFTASVDAVEVEAA